MNVVHRPARESVAIAVAPAAFVVIGLTVSTLGFLLAAVGFVVVAAATARGVRFGVTVGAGLLFAGVLYAGLSGAPGPIVLLVTAATVVTWTTAQHVVGLGEQLGRDAPVQRSVLVHLAAASVATLLAGSIAMLASVLAGDALGITGLVFAIVGGALLVIALEP